MGFLYIYTHLFVSVCEAMRDRSQFSLSTLGVPRTEHRVSGLATSTRTYPPIFQTRETGFPVPLVGLWSTLLQTPYILVPKDCFKICVAGGTVMFDGRFYLKDKHAVC